MIERLDQTLCHRCGLCLELCAMDVFRRDRLTGGYYMAFPEDCQTCFNCELECPRQAIQVSPLRRPRVQVWKTVASHDVGEGR